MDNTLRQDLLPTDPISPLYHRSGRFRGQMVQTELQEVPAGDLGEEYIDEAGLVPPAVLMTTYTIRHHGTPIEERVEVDDYTSAPHYYMVEEDLTSTRALCTDRLVCALNMIPVQARCGEEPEPTQSESSASTSSVTSPLTAHAIYVLPAFIEFFGRTRLFFMFDDARAMEDGLYIPVYRVFELPTTQGNATLLAYCQGNLIQSHGRA